MFRRDVARTVRRSLTAMLLPVGVALAFHGEASAQMFSPIQSLRSETSLQNAGGLTGDRRFLRQNRRRGDFVGRDVDASQGFVGETQGRTTGRVQTAVSTLLEEPTIPVNTPRPAASRTGIYEPRLTIAFEVDLPRASDRTREIQNLVVRAAGLSPPETIEVTLHDGVATLRGEVDSAAARDRAALVVQFEPGVVSVRNELIVRAPPEPRPTAPAP